MNWQVESRDARNLIRESQVFRSAIRPQRGRKIHCKRTTTSGCVLTEKHAPKKELFLIRIVYYVAASIDGFIATRQGGFDWLTPF